LVNPIAIIYSKGFYINLFHICLSLIVFSTYFIILPDFLEILKRNQNPKKEKAGRLSPQGSGRLARPSGQLGLASPATRRERGHVEHGHHTGSVCAASRWHERWRLSSNGWRDEHLHGATDPPGKERRVVAHRNGVATEDKLRVAVFDWQGRRPLVGSGPGGFLQHHGGEGSVRGGQN
jgi:hypothetical protein